MLDGASRIGEVVAAVAADGQPAVGITDHGNMYGALPDVHRGARRRHQAGARHGGLLHQHVALRAAEAVRARDLPPHDARRDQRGLPQPHQGHEQRLPRRLLLQAPQRLGAARASPRGHHRDERMPRRARVAADPRRRARRPRSRPRRASRTSSAATTSSSSCRTTTSTTTCGCSARCSTSPASCRRRCSRPTTATTRTRTTPSRTTRSCACRPARCKSDAEALQVRRRRLLHQVGGRDARPLPRAARRVRQHVADRGARRRRDRVRPGDPAVVPGARRPRRELVPARAHDGRARRSATARRPRRT